MSCNVEVPEFVAPVPVPGTLPPGAVLEEPGVVPPPPVWVLVVLSALPAILPPRMFETLREILSPSEPPLLDIAGFLFIVAEYAAPAAQVIIMKTKIFLMDASFRCMRKGRDFEIIAIRRQRPPSIYNGHNPAEAGYICLRLSGRTYRREISILGIFRMHLYITLKQDVFQSVKIKRKSPRKGAFPYWTAADYLAGLEYCFPNVSWNFVGVIPCSAEALICVSAAIWASLFLSFAASTAILDVISSMVFPFG
jgi:hypothetical protein